MKNPSLPLAGLLAVVLATSFGAHTASAQTTIGRANNATAFDTGGAWTGGVAPDSSQLAGFSSINTATSATNTLSNSTTFSVGGITYTNNPSTNLTIAGGTGSAISIGQYGIDTSSGNRVLTFSSTAPVTLAANQTWTTGSAGSTASQIVSTAVISGNGSLTINGTGASTAAPVYLNALNTFTGGVILSSNGAVRLGQTAPTFSGNLPTATAIGTGNFTINGGTIYGGGSTVGPQTIQVNANFAVNSGTNGLNGRFTIGGGTLDLGGAERTVTLGRFLTASASLAGGNESFRITQSVGAPIASVTNGTLRLVRGSGTASDFVSATFGTNSTFTAGTGLTIGQNVITTMSTTNPFGGNATMTTGAQPKVTVESGGFFNISDASTSRSPVIRTLAGNGTVTNLASATTVGTLTINSQSGDDTTFSGAIVDGSSLNGTLGTSANGTVALTKQGLGIQRLAGTNTYSGNTTVSAGTLIIDGSIGASSPVTVANGAQVGGDGTINGNLTLSNGARFVFDLNNTGLTVAGTFALNSSFGVASLVQANGSAIDWTSVANGTYTLINTSFSFSASNIQNFGLVNAANLSGGKQAYFQNGSLALVVIPEPSTWALMALGLTTLVIFRRRASARS